MVTTLDTRERIIVQGPAGFHPPSAAGLAGAAAFGYSAGQMKREG
jgi:hypothetical protein